ncbi:MAG: phosphoribosyltransferase family protein [Candidatus Babeliales bacterium]
MIAKALSNIFFQMITPPYCVYCKIFLTLDTIFCDNCIKKIAPIVSTMVAVTAKKKIIVNALSSYEEPLKSLILAKGWSQKVASIQMAELIWKYTNISSQPCDIWIPIPLHWTRFAWRGYNQAEVMAKIFSKKNKKPMLPILKRTKRTYLQSSLTVLERAHNISQAFELKIMQKNIKNKHIVLVDDLMTTGATLREAARILLPLKPASISAIVTCRVI